MQAVADYWQRQMRKVIYLGSAALGAAVLILIFTQLAATNVADENVAAKSPAGTKNFSNTSSASGANKQTASSQTVVASRAAIPSGAPRLELPETGVPLASVYRQLKEAADAGEVHAACRLGFELNRCRTLKAYEVGLRALRSRLATETADGKDAPKSLVDLTARTAAGYQTRVQLCAGFADDESQRAWQYMARAAEAGHVPSMIAFVVGKTGLDMQDPSATAEGWLHYRERAPILLTQALERGVPELVEFAAASYGKKDVVNGIVLYDPIRALSLYSALQSVAAGKYRERVDTNIALLMENAALTNADVERASVAAAPLVSVITKNNPGLIETIGARSMDDTGRFCGKD